MSFLSCLGRSHRQASGKSLSNVTECFSLCFRVWSSWERSTNVLQSIRICFLPSRCFHGQSKGELLLSLNEFRSSILEYWHIQSSADSNRSSSSHSALVHNDEPVRDNIPGVGSLSRRIILPRFQSFTFSTVLPRGKAFIAVEKMNDWNLSGIFLRERNPILGMLSLTGWSLWARLEWEDEERFEPAKDWLEEFLTRLNAWEINSRNLVRNLTI